MRNTFLYLLLFAVLGAGVWYFLLRDNENSFGSNEAGFTIKDTGSIGKIFLSTKEDRLTLQRTDTGWIVDGKYPVLQNPMRTLLQALYAQTAIAPVSRAAHDGVVKALAVTNTKVEVYNREGGKMRTFFVGNESSNYHGTYMLLEGASRPYVVEIKGFEGFLTPRYAPKLQDWRDRTVFNVPAESIQKLSVRYPLDSGQSFTIIAPAGGQPRLEPAPAGNPADVQRLKDYLGFFKNLNCESYVNGTLGMDSIIRTSPAKVSIALSTARGNRTADVYLMPKTQRSSTEDDNYLFDPERYYAVLDKKDTVVIQELSFKKVFQPRAAFFPFVGPNVQ